MYQENLMLLSVVASLASAASIVHAESEPSSLHIKVIAATCNNCHGPNGQSLGAAPSLAGLEKDYLRQAMLDCKTGARETTVMRKYMLGYTDEEIARLAEFFAIKK